MLPLAIATPLTATRLTWCSERIDNDTWTRTGNGCRIAAEHGNTRTELGATKRNHVLAGWDISRCDNRQGEYSPDMVGDLLTLVMVSVHENPLDQVIAILIARDYFALASSSTRLVSALTVNERNARTFRMGGRDNCKVTVHEFDAANLQTFLHNLGSKLVDAVVVSICENVVDNAALVGWRAMLAQMLDTPVAKLTMGNEVDACDDFLDGWTLKRKKCQVHGVTSDWQLTFSSSTQFSKMFCTTKLPVSPRATSCHMPRRASLTLSMI